MKKRHGFLDGFKWRCKKASVDFDTLYKYAQYFKFPDIARSAANIASNIPLVFPGAMALRGAGSVASSLLGQASGPKRQRAQSTAIKPLNGDSIPNTPEEVIPGQTASQQFVRQNQPQVPAPVWQPPATNVPPAAVQDYETATPEEDFSAEEAAIREGAQPQQDTPVVPPQVPSPPQPAPQATQPARPPAPPPRPKPGTVVNKNTTINGKPVTYNNYNKGTWTQNGASYQAINEMSKVDPESFKAYMEQNGVGQDALSKMTPEQRNQFASNYYAGLTSQQKENLQNTDAFKRLHAQNRQQSEQDSMHDWDVMNNQGVNFNSKGIATNSVQQKTPQQVAAEQKVKAYDDYNVNNPNSTIHKDIRTGSGTDISDIVNKNRELYNERQRANQTLVQEQARQRQIAQANRADAGGGSGGTFSYRDPRTGKTYNNLSMADFRRMKSQQNNSQHPWARTS